MQTYQKNGMLHGKFNFIRNQQYDAVGKTLVNCFFNQFGGSRKRFRPIGQKNL